MQWPDAVFILVLLISGVLIMWFVLQRSKPAAKAVFLNEYWPDEAYKPSGIDYEMHYHELSSEIKQQLGPFFGAHVGETPEICSVCTRGPCKHPSYCGHQVLWTEPVEDLLELAIRKLEAYAQTDNRTP